MESFAPDIVILQLGTNDLAFLSAVETSSAIEDITRLMFETCGVEFICVCQTYLKVVLEPITNVLYWCHRGFGIANPVFLACNGLGSTNVFAV